MPNPRIDKHFGDKLRQLRCRRRLSLTQVATASRHVATDSAGRISQPYLSQLEAGRTAGVALPKILTLAALYGVTPYELISETAPQRARLEEELRTWEAEGRQIPDPLDYYTPDDRRRAIDERVDALLAPRADAVSVPLNREDVARVMIRSFVRNAAILPYLERGRCNALQLFWASHESFVERVLARSHLRASRKWADVIEEFQRWLLYDLDTAEQLFLPLSRWSFDFHTELTACHFGEPDEEQRYGFAGVPSGLVSGVRWRQVAARLATAAPRSASTLPPPPSPIEGLRNYVSDLLQPGRLIPTTEEDPPIGAIVRTICELAERVPGLPAADTAHPQVLANVVDFLKGSGLAEVPATKPPRSRAAKR